MCAVFSWKIQCSCWLSFLFFAFFYINLKVTFFQVDCLRRALNHFTFSVLCVMYYCLLDVGLLIKCKLWFDHFRYFLLLNKMKRMLQRNYELLTVPGIFSFYVCDFRLFYYCHFFAINFFFVPFNLQTDSNSFNKSQSQCIWHQPESSQPQCSVHSQMTTRTMKINTCLTL